MHQEADRVLTKVLKGLAKSLQSKQKLTLVQCVYIYLACTGAHVETMSYLSVTYHGS